MRQLQSRDDQGRNEGGAGGGAADCTDKDVSGIEGDGIEAVENAVFGVQSMEVDEVGGSNVVAS